LESTLLTFTLKVQGHILGRRGLTPEEKAEEKVYQKKLKLRLDCQYFDPDWRQGQENAFASAA